MKVFVCLFAVIVCAQGSAILHHAPLLSTGTSTQSRTQDANGNYAFAYNEQHSTGGSSRSESGSPGVATGSYSLNVADGRRRTVNYVADALGFRAAIATNEPGTASSPAASTAISSPHVAPLPVAPLAVAAPAPVAVAAPLAVAHAAPVAVAAPLAVAHAAPHFYQAPLVHHSPVLAAPIAHAPIAVAHVPAISSYSTAINHGQLLAAPLAAPLVHNPAHLGIAHGLPALTPY